MPLKPASLGHLTKARSSLELFRKLRTEGEFPDWAVTALFYAAMHLVQAHFVEAAQSGFDVPRSHSERNTAVRLRLPTIDPNYTLLYNRSQWARYHVNKPDPTPEVLQTLDADHFKPIQDALEALGISLDES